jgi:hypothetical protein
MTQVPALAKVTTPDEMTQTVLDAGSIDKDTGRPDVALAVTA